MDLLFFLLRIIYDFGVVNYFTISLFACFSIQVSHDDCNFLPSTFSFGVVHRTVKAFNLFFWSLWHWSIYDEKIPFQFKDKDLFRKVESIPVHLYSFLCLILVRLDFHFSPRFHIWHLFVTDEIPIVRPSRFASAWNIKNYYSVWNSQEQ